MIRVNAHGYPRHDVLFTGAVDRLATLRANAKNPHYRNVASWRDVRFSTLREVYGACRGISFDEPCITAFRDMSLPIRGYRYADEVSRYIDHTGWYSDDEGRGKVRGIVASLSHGRYLTGYEWSDNGEIVLFLDVYTDEGEAAGIADKQAERFADDCREDSYRFDAMQDAERKTEECADALRREIKAYRMAQAAARADSQWSHMVESTRENVREALQELRNARRVLADAVSDYERG